MSKIFKFVDGTKLIARVGTVQEVKRLRDDLRKLFGWAEDLQMMFNVDKCSVLHFGYNNVKVNLELGGSWKWERSGGDSAEWLEGGSAVLQGSQRSKQEAWHD